MSATRIVLSLLSLAVPLRAFSLQMSMMMPMSIPVHNTVSRNDRIVFGTAAIASAKNPFELLDAAFDKGVRKFDLARTYGHGKSEIIFGEWMESR